MTRLYQELSRRNVIRVAAGYVVVAWIITQVVAALAAPLSLPEWFDTVTVVLLALGFPLALVFAWAFELTPDGIRSSQGVAVETPLPGSRVALDTALVAALVAMLGATLWNLGADPTTTGSADGRAAGQTGAPSIAVLPFADLSPNRDQEYFSDGIAEELLVELSRLRGLSIAGRTSAFSFKGTDQTLQSIARQLGVNHLLEGSVRRAGDTVRINVQLIDAESGFQLWTKSYDRPIDDIFAIQEDIAQSVADSLSLTLGIDAERPFGGTESTAAYEAYLRGRYDLGARTQSSIQRGFEHLRRAAEIDPAFALAHAGLADAYVLLGSYDLMPLGESHPRARTAALRAIELDPGLAEAHTSLAALNADYFWNWAEAEAQFQLAIELNPSYPIAHQWYAELLQRLGRHEESIASATRALELDPLSPLMNSSLAIAYYRARRYDEAIAQALRALELEPDFVVARIGLVLAYLKIERHDEALSQLPFGDDAPAAIDDPSFIALAGYAHGVAGYETEARAALVRLTELPNALPIQYAQVYLGLGQTDETFAWLDRAYENRDWFMGMLNGDPMWESIRDDPRFDALLERMNLAD